MFYCAECAENKGWPFEWWYSQSHGPCEVCSYVKDCVDVSCSHLLALKEEGGDRRDGESEGE